MSKAVRLKKGLDIKLLGEADQVKVDSKTPTMVALKPSDFHGLIPKVIIKEGEKVKRGEVVFYDKYNKDVKFVSPVSGTFSEIIRGEKRRILEVRIKVSDTDEVVQLDPVDPSSISREEVMKTMLENGLWPFLKQRPLDKIANPAVTPKRFLFQLLILLLWRQIMILFYMVKINIFSMD